MSAPRRRRRSGHARRRPARRPGPRLADRHARRREGARGALRALSRRADLHAAARAGQRVAGASSATPLHTSFVQQLPRVAALYRHYLPLFPAAVEAFDLDGFDLVISSQPLRGQVGGRARPAPATSATATRRCATPGTSSTPTSARSGSGRASRLAAAGAAPAGPLGRRARAAGPTAMWRILNMLRGASGATIIASAPWSRRRWIRCSSRRRLAAPSRYLLVVSALVPYKRLDVAIARVLARPACR